MALAIRGRSRNTKPKPNDCVVIEDLISNAIDDFIIRRHQDSETRSLDVSIEVDVIADGPLGDGTDIALTCTGNDCCFGDDHTEAFLTNDD